MVIRRSLVAPLSALALLLLTGCDPAASSTSKPDDASAEPEREKTLGEIYVEKWTAQEQAYAATAEGAYERMQALYTLNWIYVDFRTEHAGHEAEVPLAEWEASLTSKLDSEIAVAEATVAAWDKPMPEDVAQRPTNNLRILHGIYLKFLVAQGAPVEAVTPHFVRMLSVDRVHDHGDLVYDPERKAMDAYERAYGRPSMQAACRQAVDALPKKGAQQQRLIVMLGCQWHHYENWKEDLREWATAKEVKAFEAEFGDEFAAAIERDRKRDAWADAAAEWEAQTPPQAEHDDDDDDDRDYGSSGGGGSSSSSSSSSSAPTAVSVTIRNGCSKTVKVFFGDDPKFGSGRQSSLSGNSRQNQQMRPGDTIWLIDDSRNGLASATVSSSTREISVSSSCTGMTAK